MRDAATDTSSASAGVTAAFPKPLAGFAHLDKAMLIVNADDLGRTETATNAAIECYIERRITSTSAMVFMVDSERAAALAVDAGIDVGLHLNLSESFSGSNAPERLRTAQDRVRRFLRSNKYALLVFNPLLNREFEFVFAAQLAEFRRLYNRPPTHIDGHQHFHLASNMLIQRVLPEGARVRRSFSFERGEKGLVNRCYRNIVDWGLTRRHRTTDYFFSLSDHLAPAKFEKVLSLAVGSSVELMVHPERQNEYDFLMSDAYIAAVSEAWPNEPGGS